MVFKIESKHDDFAVVVNNLIHARLISLLEADIKLFGYINGA